MVTLSVSIDRTSLALPPLEIGSHPGTSAVALWVPEDGVGAVDWDLRRTYAPDSRNVAGRFLLGAVREAAALPLKVYARAGSSSALESLKAVLAEALAQWDFDVTITEDEVATTYRCEPSIPLWGARLSPMSRARLAVASVQIPVSP